MRRMPLQCPFCENFLVRPVDINFKDMELTGGICRCGAVYAYDRTGHNLGEIYIDALTFLCRGDFNKAMSMDPGEYETVDLDYDFDTNTTGKVSKTGKSGKLFFAKLKKIN